MRCNAFHISIIDYASCGNRPCANEGYVYMKKMVSLQEQRVPKHKYFKRLFRIMEDPTFVRDREFATVN